MGFFYSLDIATLVKQIERELDAELVGVRARASKPANLLSYVERFGIARGLSALNTLQAKTELAAEGRIHSLLVDMLMVQPNTDTEDSTQDFVISKHHQEIPGQQGC